MKTKEKNKIPGRKNRVIQTIVMTLACIVLGIVIALQYKSMSSSDEYGLSQAATITEYQTQIINLSNQLDLLKTENSQLQSKIDMIDKGTNEEQIETLKQELDDLKKFAGINKVSGEGVHITVTFPEEDNISSASAAIQMLINEIKACDAQAMSVNGERILAMSEVRVVNTYIVINGRTYTQPLDIYVIGKQSSLNSMLNMAGGIVSVLENRYGAKVEMINENNVTINAYVGTTELIGVN